MTINIKKRACHKGSMRYLSHEKTFKSIYEVIMYVGKRKVRFMFCGEKLLNFFNKTKPQDRITLWFMSNSRKYNGKMVYTDLEIKFAENPKLKRLQNNSEETNNIFDEFGFKTEKKWEDRS
jgi:hypothetical protein